MKEKYYDIDYGVQASVNHSQRVLLKDIGYDDFSPEAEQAAINYISDNPEAEYDLTGDWEIDPYTLECEDPVEGDSGWTCCICGAEFDNGFGNNPDPVKKNLKGEDIKQWDPNDPDGYDPRCCDTCNTNVVIPARIKQAAETNKLEGGLW
jgi:hypothetical protein